MFKNNKKIISILSVAIFLIANITFGATFANLIEAFTSRIIGGITSLAFGLAIIFFVWGIFVFIMNANDSAKREEGKKRMVFGMVAIFIMVSIWGLIKIARNSVSLDNNRHLEIQLR